MKLTLDSFDCEMYKSFSSLQGFLGVKSPGFVADNKAKNFGNQQVRDDIPIPDSSVGRAADC